MSHDETTPANESAVDHDVAPVADDTASAAAEQSTADAGDQD